MSDFEKDRNRKIKTAAAFIKNEKARDWFIILATHCFPEADIFYDPSEGFEEVEICGKDFSITFDND